MIRTSNRSQIYTADYENRVRLVSGTSIPAAERINLRAFYQGLADLSITPVEAWTMRSAQGPGTGATLPGLYGAYDGTLVNGPTWGSAGISLAAASSQTIALPSSFPDSGDEFAIFAVCSGSQIWNVYRRITGDYLIFLWSDNVNHILSWDSTITSGVVFDSTKRSYEMKWKKNTASTGFISSKNGVQVAAKTSANVSAPSIAVAPYIGSSSGSSEFMTGEISFLMFVKSVNFSSSALHNLYKSTIGQGLSLP